MRPRPRRVVLSTLACVLPLLLSATAGSSPVPCTGEPSLDGMLHIRRCPRWVAVDPGPSNGLVTQVDRTTDMAAGDDLVFVASDAVVPGSPFRREISVAAHDRRTGLAAWEYQADDAGAEERGVATADLALAGDAVTVVGAQDLAYTGAFGAMAGNLFVAVLDAATGEERWTSRVADAVAHAVAFGAGDGRLYVAGYRGHGDDPSPLVIAYDARTGESLWQVTFDGPEDTGETIAIEAAPDGQRLYVAIQRRSTSGPAVSRALATADGVTLWTHEHPGPIRGSVLAPDGATLYVVGDHVPGGPGGEPGQWLTALGTSDSTGGPQGQERWRREFESRALYPSRPLAVAPGGERIYLAGIEGDGRFDGTEAYAAHDGTTLWSTSFRLPTHWNHVVVDVAVSDDGGLYLAGNAPPLTTRTSYRTELVTARFDAATGEQLWIATYSSEPLRPALTSTDMASAVAVDPDGGTVYTGGSFANARFAGRAVVAYDTSP